MTTDRWQGGTGHWHSRGGWSLGHPPHPGDRVVDSSPGTLTLSPGHPQLLSALVTNGVDTTVDIKSPVFILGHDKTDQGNTIDQRLIAANHSYVGAGGTFTLAGGTVFNLQGFNVNGGLVEGDGRLDSRVLDNGTVLSNDGGLLTITGNVTGDGILGMNGLNSDLTLDGKVGSGISLDFGGASQNEVLTLGDPTQFGATIYDFYSGDSIVLQGQTLSSYSFDSGTDVLTLVLANGTSEDFQFSGDYTTFNVQQEDGGIVISTDEVCFLAGTRISTPDGERAIETLAAGDLIRTASGEARPIKWLGRGTTLVSEQTPDVTPVVVRAGAIADNVPARDLYLTRHHAILVQGRLVPVNLLVNHRSIAFDDRPRVIEYFHIELDTPDVLLAEGLTSESYRDDGKTVLFQNAWERAEPIAFLPPPVPYAKPGPELNRIWRAISERAGRVDEATLTRDHDLHLDVDGVRVDGSAVGDRVRRFVVDTRAGTVRIRSRSSVPAELGFANDKRRLGVAIEKIVIRKEGRITAIAYDDARLTEGFHAAGHNKGLRWTNGDAVLPASLFEGLRGKVRVELHLAPNALRYRESGDAGRFGKMVPDRRRISLVA